MGNDFCCEPDSKTLQKSRSIIEPKESISFESQIDEAFRSTMADSDKKYGLDDFVKKGILGEGGFATVFVVELRQESSQGFKKQYAMKQIGKRKLHERRVIDNLVLEKKVLAQTKSNFIIDMSFAFQDKINCYFVMEYAVGGDAYSFLNNPKQNEKVAMYKSCGQAAPRFIIACVILALECLHGQNIMYRDLKPENVLIFNNGYPKLTDFGLAKKNQGDQISKTLAGTKIYFCPEILQKKGHNRFVDFWTLGVFLHELILYAPPFDSSCIVAGKFAQICKDAEKNRDWKSGKISEEAKNLINSFLKVDPQQRLGAKGFDEIKCHQFFRGLDWQELRASKVKSPLEQIVKKFPHIPKEICTSSRMIHYAGQDQFPPIQGFTYKDAKQLEQDTQ